MTQVELYSRLESIGYPLSYNHFAGDENNELPEPPYIIYLRISDNNISSDFIVHGKIKNYQVELYTDKKDLEAEQRVEQVLNEIDPNYETSETYIESEALYQVVYQIKLIEKI